MKLTSSNKDRITEPYRSDCYTVESPRKIITVIDKDENILDIFPQTSLRYRIEEAEDIVNFLKTAWPDYVDDVYYEQGEPLFPIYQTPSKLTKVETKKFTRYITVYRYKQAGEWVYGFTNKWTNEEDLSIRRYKAIEAPMDGWDRWLADRKQMLLDKYTAENYGNLES